jgi:signal transduction histidine kinase
MSGMEHRRRLHVVGLVTWAIVALPPIFQGEFSQLRSMIWLAGVFTFLALFILARIPYCSQRAGLLLAAGQGVAALFAATSSSKAGILLVIVAGQLGGLPLRRSLTWIVVQSFVLGAIYSTFSDDYIFVTLAYFTFQLFAVYTVTVAHREVEARQELAAANAELQVAAGLLDLNSRSSERLRIARDLHDLLGHHLTALSLNLEIASHIVHGEAREVIDTSRSIAKNLLSDVRDVVSRLREDEPLELAAALANLPSVITTPALHLDIPPGMAVRDPALAQTALRAVQEIVTNAVRHSGARNLWVSLGATNGTLAIDARDDGQGVDHVLFGHGLQGMRERVAAANGSMEVTSMRGEGFRVEVRLPL